MGLISYGGANPFSGQADPMVSMSTSYDDSDGKWSRTDTYSFDGVFTGCDFNSLIKRQEALVVAFAKDFQKLEISGFDLSSKNNLVNRIGQVSFGNSDYLGAVPYSLSIDCAEFDKEGVKDPQDSLSFSENDDGILSVSHNISCVGVESGNCDALQTAINWVTNRLDISDRKPGLLPGYTLENAKIQSIDEQLDRLGYSYGISRNFKVDKNSTDEPTLRYTIQTCIEETEGTKISIRGSVKGGDEYTTEQVDNKYNDFLQQYPYSYTSYSVDYDPKENSLGFNFGYTEDGQVDSDQVVHNYSLSKNNNQDGTVAVSIDGGYEVEGKCGPTAYQKIQDRAGTQGDIINEGLALALDYYPGLNAEPLSYSITYDEDGAKISYTIALNDRPKVEDGGITSWTADFVVPVQQIKVVPVLHASELSASMMPEGLSLEEKLECSDRVVALGYTNRATLSLNIEAPEGSNPKEFAEKKLRELCPVTPRLAITNESTIQKDDGGSSFTYGVTFEGKPANTVAEPTTIVSDLKLT